MLGSGSWGTALVKILCENQHIINWYIRNDDIRHHIATNGHNPRYLSAVAFHPSQINLSANLAEVIEQSDLLIIAIPAAFIKSTLSLLPEHIFEGKAIVSAVKGMIPEDNLILAEYFNKYYDVPYTSFGVISGPCHAEEVALEKLSYLTMASQDKGLAELLVQLFHCRYIHTTASDDIYGTEYAAVLKNIYALAAGICNGLGYGDNFQAVLISCALKEMETFIKAVHPINRDIKDSAYLGDLLVTAYSQFSRNRTFGNMIGKGYSVKSAQMEMNMIAEGYYAAACIHHVNQTVKAEIPIAQAVYNILYARHAPALEIRLLTEQLK
jgi:glycerol-3-phosphate dehydrogenase (NAD(P)+)